MHDPTSAPPGGAASALRQRPFACFLAARFIASLAVQMQTVAIGAQLYALTHRPLDLGLVGLSQFLPFLVCVLPSGHVADRLDRRLIVAACFATQTLCALGLYAFTRSGTHAPWPVFGVLVVFGIARAFSAPAASALMPNLVPEHLFPNAVAVNSSAWQFATIAGPALGGALYAGLGPAAVYLLVAAALLAALVLMTRVRSPRRVPSAVQMTWRSVLDGLRFVRGRPVVLGAISLDLFAVLFGGATALLPAFASDVLGVGPTGLGWLRAAPGAGALLTAVWLTWRPITRSVGRAMFAGVGVFGACTIGFGLAHSFALACLMLVLLGAGDMVSVYVRHMLVQLETPDAMRGRVGAVNSMFIGASNELGEFESGLTAAWWGLKASVVVGGMATLAVAAAWARGFPGLAVVDRFPSGEAPGRRLTGPR